MEVRRKSGRLQCEKESADTQEYGSCQQNDMDLDVDMNENNCELSFNTSAVSRTAGWNEPKFMCDRECRKECFKFYDIASIMVEDDAKSHTINFCMKCYTVGMSRRRKGGTRDRRWKKLVDDKSSRDKVSSCLGARGFENKIWECCAARTMFFPKSLMEEAVTILKLGKRWTEESP